MQSDRERIYPLTFVPVFRDYIWGGRHLETLFGRELPPGIVAESWDISGHPNSPTKVASGYWRGQTLNDMLEKLGADLVGTRSSEMLARGKFPLLIKLLDANAPLSVQVHPDDAYAQVHEDGELGKSEMWYVLHAESDAELVYGLSSGVTPESFRQAVKNNTLETQLHRVPIVAGDCIHIPPGTVHSLLAGEVVAEIQQNSDTTYRVYDWGRVGEDGEPRPLHVEKALEVIDWQCVEPDKVEPEPIAIGDRMKRSLLVSDPNFVVECFTMEGGAAFSERLDGTTFEIWGCLEGTGRVRWTGQALPLEAVRFVLLPAALGEYVIEAEDSSTFLRVYVGSNS
ncbi:MAG: type I phosphomannose isomerase catalytic subunit [Chloroflexota bacterium]|nr:type I phosphomannose isomerase catalytic subunit [Chloroflexota bacterium]